MTVANCAASEDITDLQTENDDISISDEIVNENLISSTQQYGPESEDELGSTESADDILNAGEGSFTELQNIINGNETGSTITLSKNYIYSESDSNVVIDKELTIDGDGHTIDAANKTNIFTITASKVTLKNIKFINANSTNGGAVFADNVNNIKIENCEFVNCTATNGGSIYLNGNTNQIVDCNFTDNRGIVYEKVNSYEYNTGFPYYQSIPIGSYFKPTLSSACQNGGAIYLKGSDTTVKNSNFKNIYSYSSGAIYGDNVENINIVESSFENCGAKNGGSIKLVGNNNSIKKSNFTKNFIEYTVEIGGTIPKQGDPIPGYNETFQMAFVERGGAIYLNGSDNTVSDCKFDNLTYTRNGAAIFWVGDNGNLTNSTFKNSFESKYVWFAPSEVSVSIPGELTPIDEFQGVYGGNVFWAGNNGNIVGCDFIKNNLNYGSALTVFSEISEKIGYEFEELSDDNYNYGNKITFKDCNVLNNSGMLIQWLGADGEISNSTIKDNILSSYRAISWSGSRGLIKDSKFINNRPIYEMSQDGLAPIPISESVLYINGINVTVFNSAFEDNFADNGAAISIGSYVSYYGDLIDWAPVENLLGSGTIIEKCNFTNNSALMGGAIYSSGINTKIIDSQFNNNTALIAGAVLMNGAGESIISSIFEGNVAFTGGAVVSGTYIYGVFGNTLSGNNESIKNSKFTNNSAQIGGAVSWFNTGGSIDDDCVFEKNNLIDVYDKIKVILNHIDIMDKRFWDFYLREYGIESLPYGISQYIGSGAAVFWLGEGGIINNSTFISNGESNSLSAVTIEKNYYTFYNIYIETDEETGVSKPDWDTVDEILSQEIGDVFFYNENDISYQHLDTYNQRADLILEYSTVSYPAEAETIYGGAVAWSSYNGMINGSQFTKNTADYGGALYIERIEESNTNEDALNDEESYKKQKVIINNSKFNQNNAKIGAGAVFYYGDYGEISNSVFNDNYVEYEPTELTINTVLDEPGAGAIFWFGSNGIVSDCNFTNNSAYWGGAVVWYDIYFEDFYLYLSSNGQILNSIFTDNKANNGGAIYWMGEQGNISDSTFNNNEAFIAGAIANVAYDMYIKSNFTNNHAVYAGALYDEGSTTVEESTFKLNDAVYGGAILFEGDSCEVKSSNFLNNTAVYGGAIYFNTHYPVIENSLFQYNKAENGSALYVNSTQITVDSSSFLENQAKAASINVSVANEKAVVVANAVFKGNDNLINAIFINNGDYIFQGVTYWGANGLTRNDAEITDLEAGQNITLELLDENSEVVFFARNITNINGQVTLVISNVKPGRYTARVSHKEDNYYTEIADFAEVFIDKFDSPLEVIAEDIFYKENATITVKMDEGVTGNVTIAIDGENFTQVNLTNGSAEINASKLLNAGIHNVTVYYFSDGVYKDAVKTVKFNVKQIESFITVTTEGGYYKEDIPINVTVTPEDAGGKVIVTIEDKFGATLIINNTNVLSTIVNSLDVGTYNVTAFYSGDINYKFCQNTTTLVVKPIDLNANVTSSNTTTEEYSVFTIGVPDDFAGKVNITVGNISKVFDIEGSTQIVFEKLEEGEKLAELYFYNDNNYNPENVNVTFKVNKVYVIDPENPVLPDIPGILNNNTLDILTIKADNMTRGYNSDFDYQAEFLDKEANALSNVEVQFIINGKTYTAVTNNDGIAQLTTSTLAVGKYNVTSFNPVTGENVTCELEIVKRITENKDLTMDYLDGSVFKVKVWGNDGKVAPEGEIISITANGVHYVAKVDKNGYASLKINLLPRTYKIIAEYKGFKTTNKLVVKQTLKAVKKTTNVKKGKKFVLKAKLVWSNGKGIKGKVIKFKFKGKIYKAKTDKKGIAKVTIKKQVAKKLKKGKKYAVKVTYATKHKFGNGYQTISNSIKIYVKVK
ncbi:hypothetical protein [Methanobrevibacter sp.]